MAGHGGVVGCVFMVGPAETGQGLAEALEAVRKLEPSFGDAHVCKVCMGRGQAK